MFSARCMCKKRTRFANPKASYFGLKATAGRMRRFCGFTRYKMCIRDRLRSVNCLFLDEPTNHLDAVTKQALQQALRAFTGSVLLVSHEPDFYQGWADRVLDIRTDLAHKA